MDDTRRRRRPRRTPRVGPAVHVVRVRRSHSRRVPRRMSSDRGPDVTVVTVTYNGAHLVGSCLDGLARQALDGLSMDVVVVDNASTDGTAELVARSHPDVRLIRSTTNRGFAGGNNLVLDHVTSPYVILLNNDAVPEPGFVAALVRDLAADSPRVAALTATVLLADRFRRARDEDTDLSWRLRLAGYAVRYCPEAVVRHRHAASTSEGSELFRFHDGRNRLLMLVKDATPALASRALARYVLTTASIAVRRSQPWPHVRTRIRVLGSLVRLLPVMLRKRTAIGRSARASRHEVELLLVPVPTRAAGGYRT